MGQKLNRLDTLGDQQDFSEGTLRPDKQRDAIPESVRRAAQNKLGKQEEGGAETGLRRRSVGSCESVKSKNSSNSTSEPKQEEVAVKEVKDTDEDVQSIDKSS